MMSEISTILLKLIVILAFAKFGGWLAEKLRQPSVLGELLVGIILGPSMLNLIQQSGQMATLSTQFLTIFAELGAIILLFQVGLESNIYHLLKVGWSSLLVALIGVITPMLLAYGYFMFTTQQSIVALFIGATLTATSVGVTMRVLNDLKKMNTTEGKIILGAAVIDDVLGLIILSVIVSLVELGKVSLFHIGKISAWSIVFLTLSLWLGIKLWPLANRILFKLTIKRTFVISSLCLAFTLAFIADYLGLATIVGAFAAGLILETTNHKEHIKDRINPIATWLVPIFFVMAGTAVEITTFAQTEYLPLIGILFAIAIIGKIVTGFGALGQPAQKMVIGLGMIPRGEVGLIFASYGRTHTIITPQLYSVLVLVIMLTTFLTPPLLTWRLTKKDARKDSTEGSTKISHKKITSPEETKEVIET